MPALLVHGVPDTWRMWAPLQEALGRPDVVVAALPGFGAPLPDGFEPTKDAYAAWVAAQCAAIGEPVDLVGHDWGSLLVQHVVGAHPELVRTWACGGGAVDREYRWHDMAVAWQTPGVGEQVMEAMTPAALAAFTTPELGAERAAEQAAHVDGTMQRCILGLYRSAVDVGDAWEAQVTAGASTRPGLVLWGARDPYVAPEYAHRLAGRTGARAVVFEDAAHWWPVTHAAATAAALRELWA